MIVMKFGGTSTQDADAVENVVRIVRSRLPRYPVVVISAIAQATNLLERAGKYSAEGMAKEGSEVLEELFDRHNRIVDKVIRNERRADELKLVFASSLEELKVLGQGVSILRELTPQTMDAFCSYGELLSSRIIAAALRENGIPAVWIDTKDFLVTDANFTRALPDMETVGAKLQPIIGPYLRENIVPVTQGFIGITVSGRRTTMGRESSDYSASIIGSVLNAEDIEIWTDVDGVLTSDPTIVSKPMKIKVLSFEEAYELSYFGAKVLHPNTMGPAVQKNIPVHIYNSRKPEKSGTLVTARTDTGSSVVKSITYRRNMLHIALSPERRLGQYIYWENVQSILTKYNAAAAISATSEYLYSFVISAKDPIRDILHDLCRIGKTQVSEGMGVVSVVGSNIRNSSDIVNRVFGSVAELGISMISFGASPSNLSFVINDQDVPDAVRKIHKEFFEYSENDEIFESLD